jgi:histidinol-phosphate aminotransferase
LGAAHQLQESIDQVLTDRDRLEVGLGEFPGLRVYPSETNFLLVRVEPEFGMSAAAICAALKERGILIRLFENMDCLRITVGKTSEINTLLQALGEL